MANDGNFDYYPNLGAAILFAVLFGLSFIAHCYQTFKGRAWYMWALLVAIGLEVAGYITRYLGTKHFFTQSYAIVSQVAIIVAPAFMAANDYMIVGRMMAFVGPGHALIGHSVITKLFVTSDVVSIFTQVVGGTLLSSHTLSQVKLGRTVLLIGLSFQVISFAIFLLIAIAFHRKAKRTLGEKLDILKHLFLAFYISAVLIIIRSTYRTIEFGSIHFDTENAAGYVLTHEWIFYIGDSLLVIIAAVIFNIFHPSKYLPARKGLRIDGTIEPKSEKRGFWATVCCCCCCCGSRRRTRRATDSMQMPIYDDRRTIV